VLNLKINKTTCISINNLVKKENKIAFKGATSDEVTFSLDATKLNKENNKLKKRLDEKIKKCKQEIIDEESFISCNPNNISLSVIKSISRLDDLKNRLKELNNLKEEFSIEKVKLYLERKSINKNTAFLYNPTNTYDDKKAKLNKHTEIKSYNDIISKFDKSIINLPLSDFFLIDTYKTKSENPLYETAKVIDLSYPKNRHSYAMFIHMSENPENCEEFYKSYMSKIS